MAWLHLTFPLFTAADISKILLYYPNNGNASTSLTAPLYATNGLTGLTAENQSDLANGPQQVRHEVEHHAQYQRIKVWKDPVESTVGILLRLVSYCCTSRNGLY